MAGVNFQALGQSNRQGAKLQSVKLFPLRVRVIQLSGENKKKQRNMECVIRISHDPLGNPFHHLRKLTNTRNALNKAST